MTLLTLLAKIRTAGLNVALDSSVLRVRTTRGVLIAGQRDRLARYRAEIGALLAAPPLAVANDIPAVTVGRRGSALSALQTDDRGRGPVAARRQLRRSSRRPVCPVGLRPATTPLEAISRMGSSSTSGVSAWTSCRKSGRRLPRLVADWPGWNSTENRKASRHERAEIHR